VWTLDDIQHLIAAEDQAVEAAAPDEPEPTGPPGPIENAGHDPD
jgi:hypothetical protein